MKNSRKEEIIDAATAVLLRSNYQNMKTAEIAKEADISEATLYKYFKSKKDIFIAILINFSNNVDGFFFDGVNKENTMSRNFYIMGNNFYERLMERGLLYKIVYKAFSELEDEEIKPVINEIFDKISDKIKQTIKWGVERKEIFLNEIDIEILSMAIWGTTEIVFRKHLVDGSFSADKEDLLNLGAVFFNLLVK